MTITKKPTRPTKPEEQRDAIAAAFIQAADHRAKLQGGTPPKAAAAKAKKAAASTKAEKSAKSKKPADKKTVAETVTSATIPQLKEKKKKDKAKSKEKEKEKDKGKKKKDKKKEAVLIRFEDAQLTEIDANADALGLSRAAWVRMVVARALAKS
jgi:predicted DNA binding CopG/RHH family protein